MELIVVMVVLMSLMVVPTVAMVAFMRYVFGCDDAMLAELEPRRRRHAAA